MRKITYTGVRRWKSPLNLKYSELYELKRIIGRGMTAVEFIKNTPLDKERSFRIVFNLMNALELNTYSREVALFFATDSDKYLILNSIPCKDLNRVAGRLYKQVVDAEKARATLDLCSFIAKDEQQWNILATLFTKKFDEQVKR